ncbi:hypothetical protein CDAR_449241 [Caerostris darwini]|uniref:Secreted protein n=1 Tax=Caerostris darwini TaxID=1538125 RepID=A0AAV4QR73_9ARAC|nr:hypothetical protein CDAR_449241 [Caerostris darwini]
MTPRIVLLVDAIILRKTNSHVGVDMVRKDRCVLVLIHRATMMSAPSECQENILQTIMLPPPAWILPAIVAGCLLLDVSRRIRRRPSVRWSRKRNSSEKATCRHSVDVQFRYWRANYSLRHR